MSHFVNIYRNPPDPDLDAISEITLPGGTQGTPASAEIGLWGYYDSATKSELVLRVVSGSGRVQKGNKRGSMVMAYAVYGINETSVLQAFLADGRPWTAPLRVVRGASGAKRNQMLLNAIDPVVQDANIYKCTSSSFNVRQVPVPIDIAPSETQYRGLAIHVTAGEGDAEQIVKNTWGSSGVSAHFVIERSGDIVQCVALTLQAAAQGGPGSVGHPNSNWLSVELVTAMNNQGTDGHFTGRQVQAARQLFFDLARKFNFPTSIAAPNLADYGEFQKISVALADRFKLKGAKSFLEAQASSGLSCHRWLNAGHACPGLIGLRMMPNFAGLSSEGEDLSQ